MSSYPCPICSSPVHLIYSNESDITYHTAKGQFNWYKCQYCEALSIHPQVDNTTLSSYYLDDYTPYLSGIKIQNKNNSKNTISIRLHFLSNQFTSDSEFSFIDVGCGKGELLYNIRHYFPKAKLYGIDFNTRAARENLKNANVEIFEGDFNVVPDSLKFDIISSSQFMEHIQNPYNYIDFIKKHGKTNVLSINDFPNIHSTSYRLFKKKWVHLDTPRHRIHYTKKSLQILFRDFEEQSVINCGFAGAYLSSLMILLRINIQTALQKKLIKKVYYISSAIMDKVLPINDKLLTIHKLK